MDFKQTSIKQSALGWVKKSIDESLSTVRSDLNRYIEEKDVEVLASVAQKLSDLQGVLSMIEQYGAAMLTEEMRALCDYISQKAQQDQQALEVLLRAVLQLPDYLEHIQAGQKDIPIAILPLLNDIRAARHQDLFSEKLLFLPDLSMHSDDRESEAIEDADNQRSRELAKKLRPSFQFSILGLIQDRDVDTQLKRLVKISEVMEERSNSEQVARFWWIVGALIESVARDDLPLGVSVKMLLGKVDQVLRNLVLHGETQLVQQQPIELIKNLLYYIAQPECSGPKSQAIKTAYRLEQFLPSGDQEEQISGPNQELMKTVSDAVKADLEQVKSRLEVFVGGADDNIELLEDIPQELHVISDTLAMIGLGPQRQVIETQIHLIREIVSGNSPVDHEKLLGMAAELIQVDQALDLMQKGQLHKSQQQDTSATASRNFEMDNMLSGVVTAALDDIQKIKGAILEFIKEPEKQENLQFCQTLLKETCGALTLLNQSRAVAVTEGLIEYLDDYDAAQFMDEKRLDQLSQVVVSLEYYLEAVGEQRADSESILDFADEQLLLLQQGKNRQEARAQAAQQEQENLLIEDEADLSEADLPVAENDGTVDFDLSGELQAEFQQPTTGQTEPEQHDELPEVGDKTQVIDVHSVAIVEEVVSELNDDLEQLQDVLDTEPAAEPPSQPFELASQSVSPEEEFAAPELTIEAGNEISFETESEAGLPPEPDAKPEAEPEAKTQAETRTVPETETAPASEIYAETGFESESSDAAILQPEPEPEPEPELEPSYEPESVSTTESATVSPKIQPVVEDLPILNEGCDPEILEIYLEEAEEEAENIRQMQQDWKLHPEDENALNNIRRSFHTIKGSGRLVGAMKIGEFAWDFESLLNRVIDKAIAPSTAVIDAVELAAQALPELIEELKDGTAITHDIAYYRGVARALAEFKADQVMEFRSELNKAQQSSAEEPESSIEVHEQSFGDEQQTPDDAVEALADELPPEPDEPPTPPDTISSDVLQADPSAQTDVVQPAQDEIKPQPEETPPDPFVSSEMVSMPGGEVEAPVSAIQPAQSEPPDTTDLPLEAELLIIYQQEVESHLSTVNSVLDQAQQQQRFEPTEELYRSLHTIHGASRTADISSIGELASLLENPLKFVLEHGEGLDLEVLELYQRGSQALSEMTEELVRQRRMPNIPQDLTADLKTLMEQMDSHTVELPVQEGESSNQFIDTLTMMNESVTADYDDELVDIFIEEAVELLDMSDMTLQSWVDQNDEDDGTDFNLVMELQRYLHTLKGGAKMADFSAISNLSHELESLFIAVIDNRVEKTEELVDLLHESFDLLSSQVEQARQHQPVDQPEDLILRLKAIRQGETELSEASLSDQISAAESAAELENQQQEDAGQSPEMAEPQSAAEKQDTARDGESEDQQRRQSEREVVRVRSDLLDNLVSSAGEVSIYRARMEQQVSSFGANLGELGSTIARLKNQLRKLEAETDAQIHYSHKEQEKADNFDPLEMDRYTQIQELSKSLSESVDDLSSLQSILGDQVKDSETLLLQQSRINTDLQDGLIRSRMVRFSGLTSRLRRLVRKTAGELAKKAELVVQGEDHEIDIKVLDRMMAPIEHILRNSITHGIENPIERLDKGKPEAGKIRIDINRDGSDIVLSISDDGAGVNVAKVHARAIELGLIQADEEMDDNDVIQFILEPGFSTAEQVTQIAGRGVGMDVVASNIRQLGGTLQIETSAEGTRFTARLPFTLSINQAILVQVGEESYALPLINIEGITRIEADQMAELYQQEKPVLDYAGQQYQLHYLSSLLEAGSRFRVVNELEKVPVILLRSGELRVALHIDELLGNREIVVKPLGQLLSQVKGISGASILADGRVVLILDISGLIRHGVASVAITDSHENEEESEQIARKVVMVVDDSITMRRVASKLLTRNHYDVVTAKDGVDALAQLEGVNPDVMLLDIEMPRMDGFELAMHMKNEPAYRNIPIIMITSRTGEKHREHAMKIGVNQYMGKPYQEEELIHNIAALVEH